MMKMVGFLPGWMVARSNGTICFIVNFEAAGDVAVVVPLFDITGSVTMKRSLKR